MQKVRTISHLRPTLWLVLFGLVLLALTVITLPASAQVPSDGETIFTSKCSGCHTIGGGDRIGPDLQGVSTRRDIGWLERWIKEPDVMLAEGDPIAVAMLAQYNNIPMPNLALSDSEVADLVAYFQSLGDAPAPTPADQGLAIKGNPDDGEKIFTGKIPLENGGLACIACHSVEGVGILGGGVLGPDHTHVYALYGRDGLANVLSTLPFPSMQGIFATRPLTAAEQADLLEFFARADQSGAPRTQANLQVMLGVGVGLTVILFVGMLFFWPRQKMGLAQRLRKNGKL